MSLKTILNKPVIKIFIFAFIALAWIYTLAWLYSFIFEQDKLAIDRDNFIQFEKAKLVLEHLPVNTSKFHTLKEFNSLYHQSIKPVRNCFVVGNDNWKYPYIFWFELESLFYRLLFIWWNYTYPQYDISADILCVWKCYDASPIQFNYIISHPCQN